MEGLNSDCTNEPGTAEDNKPKNAENVDSSIGNNYGVNKDDPPGLIDSGEPDPHLLEEIPTENEHSENIVVNMRELQGEDSLEPGLKTPDSMSPKPVVKPAPTKQHSEAATTSTSTKAVVGKVSKRLDFCVPKQRISKTKRAGLVMSVPRVKSLLKAGRYAPRIGDTSAVYLAAVLEYLVAEVLELAGNCARYYKRHRIFPRCISLTLSHDKELEELTRGATIPQGGVKPNIHPQLLGKKGEKRKDVGRTAVEAEDIF